MEKEGLFEERKAYCMPPEWKRPNNSWISGETWTLINCWTALWRTCCLPQALGRRLGRKINASLSTDRTVQAKNVTDKIEGHLSMGELKESWCCL